MLFFKGLLHPATLGAMQAYQLMESLGTGGFAAGLSIQRARENRSNLVVCFNRLAEPSCSVSGSSEKGRRHRCSEKNCVRGGRGRQPRAAGGQDAAGAAPRRYLRALRFFPVQRRRENQRVPGHVVVQRRGPVSAARATAQGGPAAGGGQAVGLDAAVGGR